MSALEIRPATLADLTAFYDGPPPRTMRAFVALLDGKPIGIAGIAYQGHDQPPYLFSDHKPEAKRHMRAMIRGARAMLKAFSPLGLAALCDPNATGSQKLLAHLGFVPTVSAAQGIVFVYRGAGHG